MPLWRNSDDAANSAIFAPTSVKRAPNSTNQTNLYGNTTADVFITGVTVGQFGVDANEEQAMKAAGTSAPPHAGWVLRTEGSGGRVGRVFYETLVAMGSMTGDGSDDSTIPDYKITITTQPQSSSLGTGNSVVFSVVAGTTPSGGTLSYYWQVNRGAGWSNIANSGVYASANGNTTSVLSISNNATLNGNVYRVIVGVAGGSSVTSANATLTVI